MKIRRFNEGDQVDISSERINEVLDELKDFTSLMDEKSKYVESLLNELNNYKSNSQKGNDQVDDSVAALQVIKKDLDNSLDKTDTVLTNLMDYTEKGRKYLYTENK
jgi:ABC-type transporter Mla subunit MlaD